jgi:ABC-2 type transport system permease protein
VSIDEVGRDRGRHGIGEAHPAGEPAAGDQKVTTYQRIHEGREVRSAHGIPLDQRILDVWYRRDVMRMLVERGLKSKYSSSVLGYAWSLIEPAMFIATYFLLVKIFNRAYPQYPLFIASTILPWQWFTGTVNSATGALRANARLITSVNLPREIYALADAAQKAIEFVLSFPVLLAVAFLYRTAPSPFILLWPIAIVLELMICVGMALLMSALNTVLRDVQRGIGILLRMMFYLLPVLYPLQRLHGTFRSDASINPLAGLLEINRAVWFPGYWTGWRPVYFSVVGAVVVLAAGVSVFVRLERTVLKEL